MAEQRRLTAILAADVVGFSRLTGADEERTLARLRALRSDLMDPTIAVHNGRMVKRTGDGAIVEFRSVVDAVRCAIEVQTAMVERNAGLPPERRIELRIGIHLGDVVVESDGDLMGDGVNVAARLEGVAQPGAICLSEDAYRQVRSRLDLSISDLGETRLKNIAEPMRIYSLQVGLPAQTKPRPDPLPAQSMGSPLPDKPSVAVLPFTNMSGDPEQQYFSDGITEDIITELSRFRSLIVIARNSSFQYRDKATDVRRIGRELGTQYVVEGSVRRAGDRLRVTAQLIEAASGSHLWAERYDRELSDIFAVQDEVTRAICAAIPGQLDRLAVDHLRRRPPDNLTAYDCELRGRWAFFHLAEGLAVALNWYEKAVEADPTYALAHAGLGMTSVFGILSLGLPPEPTLVRGREHARKAVMLDEANPTVNCYAAFTYHISGDHRLARKHAERAVSLNPNDPFVIYVLGCALSYTGEPEQALECFARSERLEPYAPDDQRLDTLCDCYYMLRNYAKVIEIHEVYQNVPAFLYLGLAAAYAQDGQLEKAALAVESYRQLRPPGHDLKTHITYWMRMCLRQSDRDHWLEGFRKAGMDV